MKKSKQDRENILQEEIQRVKKGNDYDIEMENSWGTGNRLRPDLNVQGYCPKCASDYSKSKVLKEGRTTCEFCGTEI